MNVLKGTGISVHACRMRPFQGNLPSCPIAFVGTNASGFINKRVCQSEIYIIWMSAELANTIMIHLKIGYRQ